jgi:amino acid permease
MANVRLILGSSAILAATTLGAGIFSLPYVFKVSGWIIGLIYLIVLSAIVIFVHYLYWQALAKVNEKKRLLGLAENYLNKGYFSLASVAIVGGLLLTLVAYLILGGKFMEMVFPSLGWFAGIITFWILGSFPLIFRSIRLSKFESFGTLLMAAIIILIFATASDIALPRAVEIDFNNIFLPFGAILFSLAGWTAIEPMFENASVSGLRNNKIVSMLVLGTLAIAILYVFFVLGVFGSAGTITKDTISGLANWPYWKIQILGWLGLFAIWTSYIPIGLEVKNSLVKDLKVNNFLGLGVVIISPLLLLFLGLKDFFTVVGLIGGIFLSVQYLSIILVARKILNISPVKKIFVNLSIAIFVLGAVYEVYYFLK